MTTTLSAFDGIQLDIGLLRDIKVSPETGTAWFQGGVRADEVINTLWEQGFVTSEHPAPANSNWLGFTGLG